jgi:hypothetical protein
MSVATLMYVLTALDLAFVQHDYAMALTFAAYAVANLGLMAAAYGV